MVAALLFVFVGVSLVLLGAGGSILTVPVLVYAAGLDVHEAAGTSLLIVGAVATVGAALKFDAIDLATGASFAVTGMVGAGGGAWLNHQVPATVVTVMFAGTLLVAARAMVRCGAVVSGRHSPRPVKTTALAYGVGVGIATGFFGVGGGFLIVPALRVALGLSLGAAIATSLLVVALNSSAGLVGHLVFGAVHWKVGLVLGTAAMVGAMASVPLSGRISSRMLERAFAVLLAAVGLGMLILVAWQALG